MMEKVRAVQIVRYILKKLGGSLRSRKKLQKLVYFVDSIYDIDGLNFFMGLYGPYSRELDDLVLVEGDAYGISSEMEEERGFVITVISLTRDEEEVQLPEGLRKVVDEVVQKLGDLNGHDLELYSSVHYIVTTTGETDPQSVWETLRILKPYKEYSVEDVRRALEFLAEKGFLGSENG